MFNLPVSVLISRVITLIIAMTVHEFAHAFVADRFGDDTPRLMGRLTLNPLKHLDVFGSLLLIISGFGWAKPVMINTDKLKEHSRSAFMWVSLAGPFSNLLLAVLAGISLGAGLVHFTQMSSPLPSLEEFLFTFIWINLTLAIFNLIPLAPLDGEKVLDFLMPQDLSAGYAKLKPYGPILLLVIVFVLPRFGVDIFGWIMTPVMHGVQSILMGG